MVNPNNGISTSPMFTRTVPVTSSSYGPTTNVFTFQISTKSAQQRAASVNQTRAASTAAAAASGGTGASGSTPGQGGPTAEKRATHNAIERARRESLNIRFQELAQAIPSLANSRKPSKSVIVSKTLDHLVEMTARLDAKDKALRTVRDRNRELLDEVNRLRDILGLPLESDENLVDEDILFESSLAAARAAAAASAAAAAAAASIGLVGHSLDSSDPASLAAMTAAAAFGSPYYRSSSSSSSAHTTPPSSFLASLGSPIDHGLDDLDDDDDASIMAGTPSLKTPTSDSPVNMDDPMVTTPGVMNFQSNPNVGGFVTNPAMASLMASGQALHQGGVMGGGSFPPGANNNTSNSTSNSSNHSNGQGMAGASSVGAASYQNGRGGMATLYSEEAMFNSLLSGGLTGAGNGGGQGGNMGSGPGGIPIPMPVPIPNNNGVNGNASGIDGRRFSTSSMLSESVNSVASFGGASSYNQQSHHGSLSSQYLQHPNPSQRHNINMYNQQAAGSFQAPTPMSTPQMPQAFNLGMQAPPLPGHAFGSSYGGPNNQMFGEFGDAVGAGSYAPFEELERMQRRLREEQARQTMSVSLPVGRGQYMETGLHAHMGGGDTVMSDVSFHSAAASGRNVPSPGRQGGGSALSASLAAAAAAAAAVSAGQGSAAGVGGSTGGIQNPPTPIGAHQHGMGSTGTSDNITTPRMGSVSTLNGSSSSTTSSAPGAAGIASPLPTSPGGITSPPPSVASPVPTTTTNNNSSSSNSNSNNTSTTSPTTTPALVTPTVSASGPFSPEEANAIRSMHAALMRQQQQEAAEREQRERESMGMFT
ncbi:hypothetical protein HDU97_006957 [Phlyctochytrium planicorne]|nr:hypothetical protein HDU97_006957 [Phlyctochytrium planicorne]